MKVVKELPENQVVFFDGTNEDEVIKAAAVSFACLWSKDFGTGGMRFTMPDETGVFSLNKGQYFVVFSASHVEALDKID